MWWLAFLSHEFVLFWSCVLIHTSHTCHMSSKAIGLLSPELTKKIMEVVEDFESIPHKAVTLLVGRDKEIQSVR